jgi:hypothetical protein
MAFNGLESPVFLTIGRGGTTLISLVSGGRDEGFVGEEELSGRVLSVVGLAGAGGFIGRLETVRTTLCRSCADAVPANAAKNKTQHDERYAIFFRLFKPYDSLYEFSRREERRQGEPMSPNLKHNTKGKQIPKFDHNDRETFRNVFI